MHTCAFTQQLLGRIVGEFAEEIERGNENGIDDALLQMDKRHTVSNMFNIKEFDLVTFYEIEANFNPTNTHWQVINRMHTISQSLIHSFDEFVNEHIKIEMLLVFSALKTLERHIFLWQDVVKALEMICNAIVRCLCVQATIKIYSRVEYLINTRWHPMCHTHCHWKVYAFINTFQLVEMF